jgi:hypothetical protein
LPAWEYLAEVTATERKTSPTSGNDYLKVEYTIRDGEYATKRVYENMNIWHPDYGTRQSARADWSALVHACGLVGDPQESSEVHGIPFKLKLGIRNKKDGAPNEKEQRVDGYAPLNAPASGHAIPAFLRPAAQPAAAPAAAPPAAPAQRPAAPWAK